MKLTVLITRPDPGGARFAEALRTLCGDEFEIVMSPLMRIEPVGELPDLSVCKRLIFTSQHGVARFLDLSDRRDITGYAVGEATATVAQNAGLSIVSCKGNAQDLIARITTDGGAGPYLHIRGEHTTGDIATRLRKLSIQTDEAIVYRQVAAALNRDAQAILVENSPVVLPLFSPRSARLFAESGASRSAPLHVVAISPAVAAALRSLQNTTVSVANSPDFPAMVDAVHKAMKNAIRLEGRKRPQ